MRLVGPMLTIVLTITVGCVSGMDGSPQDGEPAAIRAFCEADKSGGDVGPGVGWIIEDPIYEGVGEPYEPRTVAIHLAGLDEQLAGFTWRIRLRNPDTYAVVADSMPIEPPLTRIVLDVPAGTYRLSVTGRYATDPDGLQLVSGLDGVDAYVHVCVKCFSHPFWQMARYNICRDTSVLSFETFADVEILLVPHGESFSDVVFSCMF